MIMRIMRKILVVWFLTVWVAGRAVAKDDFQIWSDLALSGKLVESLTLTLEVENKYRDDASEFFYYHTDVGLTYDVHRHWAFGLNYRQAFARSGNNEWKEENRPHGHITFRWARNEFKFSNRNRVELRSRSDRSEIVRYRNKTTITLPMGWTPLSVQPYISNEIFIDSVQGELNKIRLGVGARGNVSERLHARLYYQLESSDIDSWVHFHILGLAAMMKF